MTGRTHAMIGANAIWLVKIFGLPLNPLFVVVAALAALLPDLDASESMVKNLEVKIGSGRNTIGVKPMYIPAVITHALFKHRGWLHSFVAVILVGGVSWEFLRPFGVAYPLVITVGYFSHLLADACTKSGIQLFLPLQTAVHLLPRPLRIKTGGIIDSALFMITALTLVMAFV